MAIKVVWSDLHQSLTTDSRGDIRKSINIEAVKTSIDNILRTYKGERCFRPTFASDLGDLLFEPVAESLLNRYAQDIKSTIEIWDDRVSVSAVNIQADPDKNFVSITVSFNIIGYTETLTNTVTLTH